jgi:hypothetical protein
MPNFTVELRQRINVTTCQLQKITPVVNYLYGPNAYLWTIEEATTLITVMVAYTYKIH